MFSIIKGHCFLGPLTSMLFGGQSESMLPFGDDLEENKMFLAVSQNERGDLDDSMGNRENFKNFQTFIRLAYFGSTNRKLNLD